VEKKEPLALLVGMLISTAIMESSREIAQNLKVPYGLLIPLLDIYPKEQNQ
jgi:hypothetical protein